MLRPLALLTCTSLLGCAPAPAPATPAAQEEAATYNVIAKPGAPGVRVVIVNRTDMAIASLQLVGYARGFPSQDDIKIAIPPHGGTAEYRIQPDALKDHQLQIFAGGAVITDRVVGLVDIGSTRAQRSDTVTIDGATEIDISDTADIRAPAKFGLKRVVVLTDKAYGEMRQAEANDAAAAEAAKCQPMFDAVQGKPRPGKMAVKGTFRCIIAGAFDTTSKVQVVQLAGGKITATVSEIADGRTTNGTWEGHVAGDHLLFKYANADSAGDLEIDPGGHAMIGKGVSLMNNACVAWTMTCTR